MSTITTFTPQHSSPLARTISPFKDPRPPPCAPGNTAQIWDEYERRAVENAKRRDTTPSLARRQAQGSRLSSGTVYDIIRSYDPHSSPRTPSIKGCPQFDFGFPTRQHPQLPAEATTVAICKTCKGPIRSTLGICEACKKTIVLSSPAGQATPPLTPTTPAFPAPDLPRSAKPTSPRTTSPAAASPKRRTHRSSASASALIPHTFDPPIRLSSLRPPPALQTTPRSSLDAALSRPRKASLPDAADRHHLPRKPLPTAGPTSPITPPSTSHSRTSSISPWATARPCSLANITTPPSTAGAYYSSSARHSSVSGAAPSELASLPSTSPPSVCRASYSLQNTMSAWEESDSEDEEKRGLVKYWRGRRWRGSIGGGGRRGSEGSGAGLGEVEADRANAGSGKAGGKGRRRGFVRVISCGCDE
ncbi:uncharacterized protein CC84DRAFT_1237402 [Paraphaeosphaeria sporulosa]|uniref:Uncharacterized protein n=1 Tax=Paraphaeosphaeria sporulosa TaxID=1460663 RepID=A0A177CU69_9PLEO|nr:uncharacterized protein CC84DRAFT_1237402 [Paraphaeosphaeria sporulosa]OAG10558.1 hypothetical protein CC84DRAFT_1237402 [Paraphaeosphaeria sporulosa]